MHNVQIKAILCIISCIFVHFKDSAISVEISWEIYSRIADERDTKGEFWSILRNFIEVKIY